MIPEVEQPGSYWVTFSCGFRLLCHCDMTTLVVAVFLICRFCPSLSEVLILAKYTTQNVVEYWLYDEYNLWIILTVVQRQWVYCSLVRKLVKSSPDCLSISLLQLLLWTVLCMLYRYRAFCTWGNFFVNCCKFHSDGRIMRQSAKLYENQNSIPCGKSLWTVTGQRFSWT